MNANMTLTAKGQMTVPKHLRDQLQMKPGDKCYAWIRDGELIIVPRNKPLADLPGILGRPPRESDGALPDVKTVVMDAAVERFKHADTDPDGDSR